MRIASRIAASVLLVFAAPASAQIYSWRDANGDLVLSNRPRAGAEARGYAVPKTETVRATRKVTLPASEQYDDLLVEHARRNGVRPDLVRAVVQVESAYNPRARSPKGALGLMQLMPTTLRQFGVSNPFNPDDNVRAGVAYLRQLLDRYEDDEELALAAYNAGARAVDRHGRQVPPFIETRNYVAQINQMTKRSLAPRDHRIYKVTDIVDGRVITRYTDKRPDTGSYETVKTR